MPKWRRRAIVKAIRTFKIVPQHQSGHELKIVNMNRSSMCLLNSKFNIPNCIFIPRGCHIKWGSQVYDANN